jgi:hypothetical protein
VGAWATFFVSVWLYLLFLLVVGFSFSYFWTASTIIYLLMRRKVDDTEMDEIHLEETPDQAWTPPATTSPVPEAPKSNTTPVHMVESPSLRRPETPSGAPLPPTPPPPPAPPPVEAPVLHAPAVEPDIEQTQMAPPAAMPDLPHDSPSGGDGEHPHGA